jgi:hypothetical protein
MKTQLKEAIANEARRQLDAGRRTDEEKVVKAVIRKHSDLVLDEADQLMRAQMMRLAVDYLRRMAPADDAPGEQIQIEGLGVPAVIAIPETSDEPGYFVSMWAATLREVEQGLSARRRNANAVMKRLEDYEAFYKRVRPIMQREPAMTVGEALAALKTRSA